MTNYQEITALDSLTELLERSHQQPVLFFKHSNTCGVSARAFREFQQYLQTPASAAVQNAVIVVQEARAASNRLAELTDVPHESPQAILVRAGAAVWNESHLALKSELLAEAAGHI